MSETTEYTNDDSLAKFVQKAKKKLNKKAELELMEKQKNEPPKRFKPNYEYKIIQPEKEYKAFLKKVIELKQKSENIFNPIELLGGEELAKLSGEARSRKVLKISELYNRATREIGK